MVDLTQTRTVTHQQAMHWPLLAGYLLGSNQKLAIVLL